MFTEEDYKTYFKELEDVFRKSIVIYTDLLNELSDRSITSKLRVLAAENMQAFKFIQKEKDRFS